MKRHISLLILTAFLGILASLWIFMEVQAQIDSFTFLIPYPPEQLGNQFEVGNTALTTVDRLETVISIAVHRDGTAIHFDHWEDGLEPDLITPAQTSTEIWGDNNPANGIPPGFVTDVLNRGSIVVLRNLVPLPRITNDLLYDGGDVLTAVGGALAVTMAAWPNPPSSPPPDLQNPGTLYAGAWELYPTNRWGIDYRIPVGQNLAGVRGGFTVVGFNVQAVLDNTTVEIDLNGDGAVDTTRTLDRGQQFTAVNGVGVGARVAVTDPSKPVQVHVFSADPANNFEARAYTMVPFDGWSDDILAPRSSDGDVWLYNPNGSTLNVTARSFTATTVIAVPANSTVKYPTAGLSPATGIRFTSTDGRPFYGVAALDAADTQDWGYSLLPIDRLATQTLVGWGPGNINDPPLPGPPPATGDESRVYVTAVVTTNIVVDYENDGIPDATYPVLPLQEVAITDTIDFDMTGAYLSSDNLTPFLAVWGQDQTASPALPSIDVGTSIVPLPALLVQKTNPPFIIDPDCSGTVTLGDTILFNVKYDNNTVDPVTNIIIEDFLPSQVDYVPDSTIITSGPSLGPVPDDVSGNTRFPLDEGGYNVGDIPVLESGSLEFKVFIADFTTLVVNSVNARSLDLPLGDDTVFVFTPVITQTNPVYEVSVSPIDPANGLVTVGDMITFSLTITNSGSLTFTKLLFDNTFDQNYLTFLNADPPPDTTAPGIITWNDLTSIFGQLPPGRTLSLTTSFVINPIPPAVNNTQTVVTLREAVRNDRITLQGCSGQAQVGFITAPTATPSPTPPPSQGGDDDDDASASSIPTPIPTLAPVPAPKPTAALPVQFLPETGLKETRTGSTGFGLFIVVVLSIGLITFGARKYYRLKRQ